uniref:Uncharacterized protein n=1 Tax=Anguilla anguilla TaxID=7936 RepID=A0A0E9X4B3_ANGAN
MQVLMGDSSDIVEVECVVQTSVVWGFFFVCFFFLNKDFVTCLLVTRAVHKLG